MGPKYIFPLNQVDRTIGIRGSYYNTPYAIFYLLKGDYILLRSSSAFTWVGWDVSGCDHCQGEAKSCLTPRDQGLGFRPYPKAPRTIWGFLGEGLGFGG